MMSAPRILATGLISLAIVACQPAADTSTTPATAPATTESAPAAEAATPAAADAAPASEAPATPAANAAGCGQLIQFAAGDNDTTVEAQVQGYESCSFRMQGQAGQKIKVELEGSSYLTALLFAPSNDGTSLQPPGDRIEATLPASGEYELRVGLVRAEARRNTSPVPFKLEVELN